MCDDPCLPSCEHCGGDTRPLIMRGDSFVVRCRSCGRPRGFEPPVVVDLPPVNKALIYLDQFVYEHLRSGRWAALGDKLSAAVRDQLVVCARSDLHGAEATLAPAEMPGREEWMSRLSDGVWLHAERTVRLFQLTNAAEAWLDGRHPEPITRADVIADGRLDHWTDLIRINVGFPAVDGLEDELRQNRDTLHTTISSLYEQWSGSAEPPAQVFATVYEQELHAFGRGCVAAYQAQLEGTLAGTATYDDFTASLASEACTQVLSVFRGRGLDYTDAAHKLVDFLVSDEVRAVPFVRINAAIWAAIAQAGAAGQRTYLPSTPTDVRIVSTFLPYCDVMFLDRNMAGLLRNNPLRAKLTEWGLTCKVISAQADLVAYLDALRDAAPPEQLSFATLLYGGDTA